MNSSRIRFATLLALSALLPCGLAWGQVTATIGVDAERLQGTDANGQVLLYSPDPIQGGSSISHWDPSATPDLLMEPSIASGQPVRLAPDLMKDIGWKTGTSIFNIFPLDLGSPGFDDPRPFPGAPGNAATTLGQARVNLFSAVMNTWGQMLDSNVEIDVVVGWTSLPCDPSFGAVLAAASTLFLFADENDDVLPVANTWFPSALAEALTGEDLSGPPEQEGGDIIVFMNSDVDNGCLGEGTGYYYGVDGNGPANLIDASATILHELAHGLGFANFTDESTGELIGDQPGIFDTFTQDGTSGKTWDQMTDAERRQSAVNVRKVSWTGENVNETAQGVLEEGVPELEVASPPSVAGTYEIGTATFGASIPVGGLTGEIACLVDDEADPTLLNGCTAATNPQELAGKIALIDRGSCAFVDKVAHAQDAGAIGAIIVNNAGNSPVNLGGEAPAISIPAVGLGSSDGVALRKVACASRANYLNGDRFQVTAQWTTSTDSGAGVAVPLTDDTGYFYFFDEANVELVVKVLDGCSVNDNFWVFAAGLTNVEVALTVTDTRTGMTQVYNNPPDTSFQPIQDTAAFATCP